MSYLRAQRLSSFCAAETPAAGSTCHSEACDCDRCCGRLCDKSSVEKTHEDKSVLKLDKDGHPVRPRVRLAQLAFIIFKVRRHDIYCSSRGHDAMHRMSSHYRPSPSVRCSAGLQCEWASILRMLLSAL